MPITIRKPRIILLGNSVPTVLRNEWNEVPSERSLDMWEEAAKAVGWSRLLRMDEVSTRGVIDVIRAGVECSGPLIVVWCGHGLQVADLNGDEPDRYDEVLCTRDFNPAKPETWLTDDRLYACLEPLMKHPLVVILDACHSAGWLGDRLGVERVKEKEIGNASWRVVRGAKVVSVAAAPEDTQAWYNYFAGRNGKLLELTWALTSVLIAGREKMRDRTVLYWLARACKKPMITKPVIEASPEALALKVGSLQ